MSVVSVSLSSLCGRVPSIPTPCTLAKIKPEFLFQSEAKEPEVKKLKISGQDEDNEDNDGVDVDAKNGTSRENKKDKKKKERGKRLLPIYYYNL